MLARVTLLLGCGLLAACASSRDADPRHAPLGGTAWQLVEIQSMDDTKVANQDPAKYTLSFAADGMAAARIDCNRGAGPWKATPGGELVIGPLAVTRAMCPPGSMHDRVLRDLSRVRSYVTEDGKLYLSLMADGGIYVFEPRASER
jgi:para-nitrobenzyl esterase